MSHQGFNSRLTLWFGIVGPIIVIYSFIGVLVAAGVPHIFPENALTTYLGGSAKAGAFAIWLYLAWRIFNAIKGIYGTDSGRYLEQTSIWRGRSSSTSPLPMRSLHSASRCFTSTWGA